MSSSDLYRMGLLFHFSLQQSFPAVKEFHISSPQNLAFFNRRVRPRRCMYPRNELSMEETGVAVTHPEKTEIFKSLEEWAKTDVLVHLKPVEKSWQPQDFLPDPSSEGFFDQVHEIRARSMEIPDDYYVCLVGDLITEEALPTYESLLNRMDGIKDETGASPCSWAIWTRNWTAEENRHGDLLNKYLYLCGRVDMRQVEKTIQYLISSGTDVGVKQNPYLVFVYTSFQERATFISHGSTAKHAKYYGDPILAKICGTIASDEKRHETAYAKIVEKLFEIDPDTMMQAFACMMKRKITMPGILMFDGQDDNLFDHFSSVAQRMGVYTAKDYVDNVEFFVKRWKVDKITVGLSGEGRQAQDYLCNLPTRMKKLVERTAKSKTNQSSTACFSWIFNREVMI